MNPPFCEPPVNPLFREPPVELEFELEFYLFDRQLHNIGEIISKKMCEIILSGDSHKGTNWPLA